MNAEIILEEALCRTAIIHQSHSIKAYLSAIHLDTQLHDFNEKGWQRCREFIDQSDLAVNTRISEAVESREFNAFRRDGILKRGLFPASYIAMQCWLAEEGIDKIFSFYEEQATAGNEYLLHSVSILLAFKKIWPKLTEKQIPIVLERFTEFVTSTYYNKNHIEYPVKEALTEQSVSVDNVVEKALIQPGFWGHNLICLSWLLRCEKLVDRDFKQTVLRFIFEQSHWDFTDSEDILDLHYFKRMPKSSDINNFYDKINSLLYDSLRNVHQITLASSLVDLWDRFDDKNIRETLYKLCVYFLEDH